MKIKVIYRNYKPLHSLYTSYFENPPKGVEYTIPAPKKYLARLFPLYKKFGDNFLVKRLIKLAQSFFFTSESGNDDHDLLEFIQIIPEKIPTKPYIVNIEHFFGLLNFVKPDAKALKRAFDFLNHENCKTVICLSNAAKKTVLRSLGAQKYKKLEKKLVTVHVSLDQYGKIYKKDIDYSIINPKDGMNLLMLGNSNLLDTYKKGVHEMLEAAKQLRDKGLKINTFVIHNATEEIKEQYNYDWAHFFPPKFGYKDKMTKLFLPADVFVMPVHQETYGMVFLEALCTGTPIIAVDQFATPELFEEGKTGLFVKSSKRILDQHKFPTKVLENKIYKNNPEESLVKDLMKKIQYLYDNPKILKKMSANALKYFEKGGRFSLETRNKKLIAVYKKALGKK